ncbi:FkbM family methyltransferase [Komagataeibacter sp. FNDCF1]|uniref:FkbM family methyltransferase n=1 Tax=Komagataeibacter sp. FNDCF1 TaxID=2878681 RepID=UPI00351D0283|nr:FkbM family methyltransferase [Komagataeibacter sp. FNDCF1]
MVRVEKLSDRALIKAAVGERDETGTLIQTNMDYGGGTIGQGKGETVRIRPLLDILKDLNVNKIDVLKIDIEGYEDKALLPFLATAPASLLPDHIIMEYSERDRWQSDLMSKLKQVGYLRKARSRGNILMSRK